MVTSLTSRRVAALVLLVLGLPLVLAGWLSGAGPASAAVIPSAITSITTTASPVTLWDEMAMTCTWAVPDHSSSGDTFTMALPPELKWWGATSFDLKNTAGDVVATAVADDSGLVTFTLSPFVDTHPLNVGGTCEFTTQYVATQTVPGTVNLNFPVGATVITVPVTDNGTCIDNCVGTPPGRAEKFMWWTDHTQVKLQSQIVTPATTADTNTVTITDTPGAGMALDCSTVRLTVGKTIAYNGEIAEPFDTALYPGTVSCAPTGVTVVWSGLPAGEFVQLHVQGDPTGARLPVYTNSGLVSMNGSDTPVAAEELSTTAGGTGDGEGLPATTPAMTPPLETTPATTPSGQLASTGASERGMLVLAGTLLLLGAVVVGAARKQARQH